MENEINEALFEANVQCCDIMNHLSKRKNYGKDKCSRITP